MTGTNGKTTTVRLIAHIFRHTGKTVGFTTTDGVYLNNRLVIEGDMTGPFSANIILSNPTVDVAVLETARGGIIRAGLGFDEADVGVVLNVSADHLGLGGINTLDQLADVKSVIAAVVKREGHAVLNADDPLVLAMRERSPGDIVLFSTMGEDENPAITEHLARAGIAVLVERDTFVIRRGRLRIPIASVRQVPLMMGGAARFQRGNILAAIGTAYVQGIRYDDIRAGLLSFFPSPALTPGRLNLMRVGRGRLLVDYAHNAAAVGGLMELVASLDASRRFGVITAPGDRRDEDIRELGRLAAGLDRVIVKEDNDRRGREPGEIARLVRDGLTAGGMSPDAIEVVADEMAAVDRLVANARGPRHRGRARRRCAGCARPSAETRAARGGAMTVSDAGKPGALPDPATEIRMTTLHATRGANYWSRRPVTRVDVIVGAYDDISSAHVPGVTAALVGAMPSLIEHRCSIGERGGFIIRLRRGTYIPHIVEHVALELQTPHRS